MSDIKSKSWIKNQVDMIFEEVKTATPNQRDSVPYRRKLANKYQTFFEKFPSLLMSIIDQGENFDMKRLNEMLNLMTDIHSGEKKMEDVNKEMGQKYFNDYVAPVIDMEKEKSTDTQ